MVNSLLILQVTESDTMRTFLPSILWVLLLHCCCQMTQAEVFTSISRFKWRFNLIKHQSFWTQTSIWGVGGVAIRMVV